MHPEALRAVNRARMAGFVSEPALRLTVEKERSYQAEIAKLNIRVNELQKEAQFLRSRLTELEQLIPVPVGTVPSIRQIADLVAQEYDVTVQMLMSAKRTKIEAEARQVICYLASQIWHIPDGKIANFLNRDRTTIMYNRDRMAELVLADSGLAQRVEAIKQNCYSRLAMASR